MQFAFRNRKLSASRPEDEFLTSDEVRACSQAALGIEWRHENENLYMHNRCRKHVGQHRIRADAHNLGLGVSMFENSGDSPRRNALLDSPAHNGHNHYRHVCVWFYRKRPVQVPRRTTERRSVSGGNEPNPAVGLRSRTHPGVMRRLSSQAATLRLRISGIVTATAPSLKPSKPSTNGANRIVSSH